MMKISICSKLPVRISPGVRSMTPTNREQQDNPSSSTNKRMVDRYCLIKNAPFFLKVSHD